MTSILFLSVPTWTFQDLFLNFAKPLPRVISPVLLRCGLSGDFVELIWCSVRTPSSNQSERRCLPTLFEFWQLHLDLVSVQSHSPYVSHVTIHPRLKRTLCRFPCPFPGWIPPIEFFTPTKSSFFNLPKPQFCLLSSTRLLFSAGVPSLHQGLVNACR